MDMDKAKIFVGGISRDTSEDALRVHFSKYGTVSGSLVAKDKITKNSRGFGFVWFSDSAFVDKALQDSHVILGRTVEVKKAIPKTEQLQFHRYQQQQQWQFPNQQKNSRLSESNGNGNGGDYFRTKKIFVGGLSSSLTEEQFKDYFESFGKIVDVVVMQDSSTNRPRGFGFVTFDSEDSVDKAMEKTFHELMGKRVEVKRAVPKEEISGTINSSCITKGGIRGSSTNSSRPGNYLSYSPGYEIIPSCVPLSVYSGSGVGGYTYGTGIYGTYPLVGYSRPGFGVTPVAFNSPWIGATMFPSPYNNAFLYPAYTNGGFSITNTAVRPEGNGKLHVDGNGHQPSDASPPSVEGIITKSGVDSSSLKGSEGGCSI
ncbi:RNA-binding protein 1 [Ricinus communis]|uniref:DAZ-associated protein, putative n=1 Tax=Ricinus communis TaxID=3988 RepID=B9R6V8_RICCO|nr:RNA-binding protein 1 [Ricinus communis]EEF52238.1 DAZ-associated protein, putative [Ricinus communis]|eukprot:XP_002510051.1 RNA-binding protein 1 [Ricinus communis]